jgi:MFS family permease
VRSRKYEAEMFVIRYQFDLSSAQTGLVFTAFGTAYTLATPVFGILSDKVCFHS